MTEGADMRGERESRVPMPGWARYWTVSEAVAILPLDHRARREILPYAQFDLAEAWPYLESTLQGTLVAVYIEFCLSFEAEMACEGAGPAIRGEGAASSRCRGSTGRSVCQVIHGIASAAQGFLVLLRRWGDRTASAGCQTQPRLSVRPPLGSRS